MLQPELIHNLNMIAYEGWEYHKLPLENLDNSGSSQGDWVEKSGVISFQRQPHKKLNASTGSNFNKVSR
jgi:hypothetical protein